MSDPERLLDMGGDDLGAALLRAGRTLDTERAHERKIALLGAGAGLAAAAAGTAGARTGAHAVAQGIFTKWLVIGLATATIAGGVAVNVITSRPEVALTPVVRATLDAHPPVAAAEIAREIPPASETTAGISIHSLPDAPIPGVAATGAQAGAASQAAAGATEPGLAAEVAALREAREALGAGKSGQALAALDVYSQQFPRGRLGLEAEVLRIEALARGGSSAAAAARARSFLAAHPDNPYAHRVRALALLEGAASDGASNR